jgi:hypothetical protein
MRFLYLFFSGNVLLLFEPGYVTPCVGNLTEEKFCANTPEFPTGVGVK